MPDRIAFAIFATPIGECAVAWDAAGLVGTWLPARSAAHLRGRIRGRWPGASEIEPTAGVASIVDTLIAGLEGRPSRFDEVVLVDSAHGAFDRRVWAAAREVPRGRVVTYAELARRLGSDATPREVGAALGRNPFPMVVPCHRIVATGGSLGGFSAPGGSSTKRRLLTIEDARLEGPADLFDQPAEGTAPNDGSTMEVSARS